MIVVIHESKAKQLEVIWRSEADQIVEIVMFVCIAQKDIGFVASTLDKKAKGISILDPSSI